MENVINILKEFFLSSKMKTFYWQTGNGFLVILAGTLMEIKPDEIGATTLLLIVGAISVLNRITKEINKKYLS